MDYSLKEVAGRIKDLREAKGYTQEFVAEAVGVSRQAVSKWEQQTNCPDIMLLPELASIFGVTIDELFGNESKREIIYSLVDEVPWNDDGKLRIAVYSGRKLAAQSSYICNEGSNVIRVCFHGENYNISGVCKIDCGRASGE